MTRWDEENCCALCFGCHQYLDSQPIEKVEFFKEWLGENNFNMLNSRVRQVHPKPDKNLLMIYYQSKIKALGKGTEASLREKIKQ